MAVICHLASVVAYAEPSVSSAHRPILWAIVVAGAVVAAVIPPLIRKYAKVAIPSWGVAAISIILVLVWIVFAAPTILVFGSILMTGRTM